MNDLFSNCQKTDGNLGYIAKIASKHPKSPVFIYFTGSGQK